MGSVRKTAKLKSDTEVAREVKRLKNRKKRSPLDKEMQKVGDARRAMSDLGTLVDKRDAKRKGNKKSTPVKVVKVKGK
jgi:hypothetical protein